MKSFILNVNVYLKRLQKKGEKKECYHEDHSAVSSKRQRVILIANKMKPVYNYDFIRALSYVNRPFSAHLVICYFFYIFTPYPFSDHHLIIFFSDSQYQKVKIKGGQKRDEGVEVSKN